MSYSTENYRTFSSFLITLTVKLSPKPGLATSMTTSFGLSQKSSTCQNCVNMDIMDSTNQLDSNFNNRDIKTNIIVTISNTDIS